MLIDLVGLRPKWNFLMLNGQQFRRVMDGAIAVVVVAAAAFADLVETLIPSETSVAQARTRRPSTSTMQVSHV